MSDQEDLKHFPCVLSIHIPALQNSLFASLVELRYVQLMTQVIPIQGGIYTSTILGQNCLNILKIAQKC